MKPRKCEECGSKRLRHEPAVWNEGLAAGWECMRCEEFYVDEDDPDNMFEVGGDDYRGDAAPGL